MPAEDKHLKGMVALLVGEMRYVVELHIAVKYRDFTGALRFIP